MSRAQLAILILTIWLMNAVIIGLLYAYVQMLLNRMSANNLRLELLLVELYHALSGAEDEEPASG